MATVVIAPDGFGGTLAPGAAAAAIADGWRRARPNDRVIERPLSDGGEGLLDVVSSPGDTRHDLEVVGPDGRPVIASWLERGDGSAVIESAQACGLHLLPAEERDPMRTTTWGVGELLRAVMDRGIDQVSLGLGGSATIDAASGALLALGFRLLVADGSGLKIGAGDLHRLDRASRAWASELPSLDLRLLADVRVPLVQAATRFGRQKGATDDQLATLDAALAQAGRVLRRDLAASEDAPQPADPMTGAAGGLGFGLAVALHGELEDGAAAVADLVGLDDLLDEADLVVTGEGRLDATTADGKVVHEVVRRGRLRDRPVMAVVGQHDHPGDGGLDDLEAAAPGGAGPDPAAEVAAAAARLASRF